MTFFSLSLNPELFNKSWTLSTKEDLKYSISGSLLLSLIISINSLSSSSFTWMFKLIVSDVSLFKQSAFSTEIFISLAISSIVGSLHKLFDKIFFAFIKFATLVAIWQDILMFLPFSCEARSTVCLIHHVAYVENL